MYPIVNPTQNPLKPLSSHIFRAVSPILRGWPSPTAPPTCILRRIISSGYDDVWEMRPARAPENSSAVAVSWALCDRGFSESGMERENLSEFGMVVYGAKAGRRSQSPMVSCVRKDIPAYGNMPTIVGEKPR